MKYCTYVRFQGILGWLHGWFLVGISDKKRTSGYVTEFARFGIKVLLLEMEPPLTPGFHFVPNGAKIMGSGTMSMKTIGVGRR
jgi:hypothetical protein